jgi:hypothetical protein
MALEQVADPGFEARWTAWQQRGAAHDRATKARMRIVLPLLAGLAIAISYVLTLQ